jgi:hypothetical protein
LLLQAATPNSGISVAAADRTVRKLFIAELFSSGYARATRAIEVWNPSFLKSKNTARILVNINNLFTMTYGYIADVVL